MQAPPQQRPPPSNGSPARRHGSPSAAPADEPRTQAGEAIPPTNRLVAGAAQRSPLGQLPQVPASPGQAKSHAIAHWPPLQPSPDGQTMPQPPQFSRSFMKSTAAQAPAQQA